MIHVAPAPSNPHNWGPGIDQTRSYHQSYHKSRGKTMVRLVVYPDGDGRFLNICSESMYSNCWASGRQHLRWAIGQCLYQCHTPAESDSWGCEVDRYSYPIWLWLRMRAGNHKAICLTGINLGGTRLDNIVCESPLLWYWDIGILGETRMVKQQELRRRSLVWRTATLSRRLMVNLTIFLEKSLQVSYNFEGTKINI